MKFYLLAALSLFQSACSEPGIEPKATIENVGVSPDGILRFSVINQSDDRLCSSNYGVGTILGMPSLIFPADNDGVHQNIFEFRESPPELERIEFAPHSRQSFEVNFRENYWVNTDQVMVGVKIPIWNCEVDIPLQITLEHEQQWGPEYLKERGVNWVSSSFISPDVSTWAPEP